VKTFSQVLIVDDEEYICDIVEEMLCQEEYLVYSTSDFSEALSFLESKPVDLVLTDFILKDKSGLEILQKTKSLHADAVVIVMTGKPSIETAITVLKQGAYDFLIKPFTTETLRAVIKRGLEKQRLQRENIHLKEAVSLYEISSAMTSEMHLDSLLHLILDSVVREFRADMASILLYNEKSQKLEIKASLGMSEKMVKNGFLAGNDPITKWVMEYRQPQIINKDKSDKIVFSEGREFIKSLISHPLLVKGNLLGTLNLIRTDKLNPFSPGQLQSLSIIASKAATAIENSRLYEGLKDSYLNSLTALANAVEARDIYTRGHTERVWYLAELIAKQLNWSEDKQWEVRMGGVLHDIGKIGVPDAILNKPTQLTADEFEIMKEHTTKGVRILEGIPFLKPALPYVLYHHERYDGKGYPEKLTGDKIPVQGRLMAVVDTFDAITSDRPYRPARNFQKALREIEENKGTQFDPLIAEIFLEAWLKDLVDKEKLIDKKGEKKEHSVPSSIS
jgi:response regulator RpfG family c-di-GMP phosphodiesterase